MRLLTRLTGPVFLALVSSVQLHAQVAVPAAGAGWHASSLLEAIGNMLLFAFIGIAVAILGYRLFDHCTPGDLHREIIENKNVAASLIGAAIILGVCIIVAAAMLG